MAFTSCHGQPLSSERSGGRAAGALASGITMVRVRVIVTPNGPAPGGAGKNVSFATYTHWRLRCNSLATAARAILSRFLAGRSSVLLGPPSFPVHLGVLRIRPWKFSQQARRAGILRL